MTTTLPDALSDATRTFVSRTHGLLIGGEVDRAVGAARAAFADGSDWRKMPAPQRALALHRLADLIDANADELAEIEALDNGKPVKLAKVVDVAQTVAHFRYFAGWPTKIEGSVVP